MHGEATAIVGVSGRGKTTLLRILAGLLRPLSGTVEFHGAGLARPTRSIAVVFQNYSPTIFDWLSVEKNILLGIPAPLRVSPEVRDRIREVAAELSLQEYLQRPAKLLSGGQKQRVAIARALVQKAEILIFDEPFSNLDPVSKHELIDALLATKRKYEATLIIVSHDVREALILADVAYCLLKPSTGPQLHPIEKRDLRDLRRVYTLEERFGHVYSMLLLDHTEES